MRRLTGLLAIVTLSLLSGCTGGKKPVLSVPYETYKLANGLTVILNEDKSDPITSLDESPLGPPGLIPQTLEPLLKKQVQIL